MRPQQLLLLWCGLEAQLHMARIRLEAGQFGTAVQPKLRLAKLKALGFKSF